jgi:hypothetical protein
MTHEFPSSKIAKKSRPAGIEPRGMFYVLSEQGEVKHSNSLEWAKFRAEHGMCMIGRATIGGILISTVFVGLNSAAPDCKPEVFETYIANDGCGDIACRYATLEEARAGHEKYVAEIQRRLGIAANQLTEGLKVFKP